MRRFFLLMVLAASILRASSFTSCTFETYTITSDTGCNIPMFSSGMQIGVLGAYALTGSYASGTQLNLNADGNVEESADLYVNAYWKATAQVNDDLTLASSGSKRAGFVQFDVTTRFSSTGPDLAEVLGEISITDGVHDYSYRNSGGSTKPIQCSSNGFDSCEFAGTVPFNLGTAFQVFAKGDAEISDGLTDFQAKSDGGVSLTLSLLEADGKTAVPFFITPEPSTWALFLLGLPASAFFLVKRKAGPLSR